MSIKEEIWDHSGSQPIQIQGDDETDLISRRNPLGIYLKHLGSKQGEAKDILINRLDKKSFDQWQQKTSVQPIFEKERLEIQLNLFKFEIIVIIGLK